ncbi:MAG TPA: cation diffusion facilitator family transporter [Planctomycetota bacterium]|nr:cation diffusion facilitator family transporter [Planctomycetota bacterium]
MRSEGTVCNLVGIAGNVILAAIKFLVAAATGSTALLADAWHSVGDTLQTVVTAIGFVWGRRPPDADHPYGHGNIETLAALAVALVLLATGVGVAYEGVRVLRAGGYAVPGVEALPVAVLGVVVKEALARYTMRIGRRLNSPSMVVAAKDHRADALSSIAVVFGILGARLGAPSLDPAAAVVIGLSILALVAPSVWETLSILAVRAPTGDMERRIQARFAADPQVRKVHRIRMHRLGSYYEVDLEIDVDGDLTVREGHAVAHRVRDEVLAAEPFVSEVKVHVNPHPESCVPDAGGRAGKGTAGAPARIMAGDPPATPP